MKPLVLINFKIYSEATGKKGVALARAISTVRSRSYDIAIAPEMLILHEVIGFSLPVYAQHVDPIDFGAHTGQIVPAEIKKIGCVGTLLNHSERKISVEAIEQTVLFCKREKLKVVVCASTLNEVRRLARFKPDYIAYEPAALIGGDVSVTSAKPSIIKEVARLVSRISPATKVLCGAGVHNKEDLKAALRLGACGVLLSHAVVKAKNPKKFLEEMLG